jgi:hypothetical protein
MCWHLRGDRRFDGRQQKYKHPVLLRGAHESESFAGKNKTKVLPTRKGPRWRGKQESDVQCIGRSRLLIHDAPRAVVKYPEILSSRRAEY